VRKATDTMSRKICCLIFEANVLGPRFAHILGLTCRVFLLSVSVTHRCARLRLPVVKHDTSTPPEHRNQNRNSRVFEKTVGAGLSRDSFVEVPSPNSSVIPRFEYLSYNQTAERGRSCPTSKISIFNLTQPA